MNYLKVFLFHLIIACSLTLYSQDKKSDYHGGGYLNIGVRSTTSLFNSDGNLGFGTGGQIRLGLTPWLNTEWFADYITTDLFGLGKRTDIHIGWSVLFYPFQFKTTNFIQPFIAAGHCFDFTNMQSNNYTYQNFDDASASRWSSAVQLGLGNHFHLNQIFDLSINAQYMWHFGNRIGVEVIEDAPVTENPLHIHESSSGGNLFEGHLLLTLSLNVKIGDLW